MCVVPRLGLLPPCCETDGGTVNPKKMQGYCSRGICSCEIIVRYNRLKSIHLSGFTALSGCLATVYKQAKCIIDIAWPGFCYECVRVTSTKSTKEKKYDVHL
jgi:hypothetical protein